MAGQHPTKSWICSTVENREAAQSEEQNTETNPQGQHLVLLNKHKWPKQGPGLYITLEVNFMEPAPQNGPSEDEIVGWMNEWSKYCGVKFQRTLYSGKSDIRVTFTKGKGGGNWTLLGTVAKQKKNQSTMNLEDVVRHVVLHETGHALGFVHEHQNPYVDIDWNQPKLISIFGGPPHNWTAGMIKSNIIDLYTKGEVSASKPADPKSIMAYQLDPSWVKNFTDVPSDFFKENTELSDGDKQMAALWYPMPQIPGLPAPTPLNPQIPEPPILNVGGGIPSDDIERDALTDVHVVKKVGMSGEEKSALQKAHVELIKGMNPTALKDLLYNRKLLTPEEYEKLDLQPTTADKNRFIVMLLPRKGSNAFRNFVACLRETGGENEAHTELVDMLQSYLHDE